MINRKGLDGMKNEILKLEKQLSCPDGEFGVRIGHEMLRVNANMIQSAFQALDIKEGDCIIELGHGNAGHISSHLFSFQKITYVGLEISITMNEEAIKNNKQLISDQKAEFHLYDGTVLPLENDSATKVISINSIYFWKEPEKIVFEIIRVLKPGGKAIIALADETYLKKQMFTKNIFSIYSKKQLLSLFTRDEVKNILIDEKTESIKNTAGEKHNRKYLIVTVEKK